jgi:hypothetical protein
MMEALCIKILYQHIRINLQSQLSLCYQKLFKLSSSGLCQHVVLWAETDVSEEHAASIFSVGVCRVQQLYIMEGDKEGVRD